MASQRPEQGHRLNLPDGDYILVVAGWHNDIQLWMEHGHWTPMALLPEMLDSREVYVWDMDERQLGYCFEVEHWESMGGGSRVYRPHLSAMETLLDPVTWPASLEAVMNKSITGDADRWAFVPCFEASFVPTQLLDDAVKVDPLTAISMSSVARARCFDAYRNVSRAQRERDFRMLVSTGCLPSAYNGIDLEALISAWLKQPFFSHRMLSAIRRDPATLTCQKTAAA